MRTVIKMALIYLVLLGMSLRSLFPGRAQERPNNSVYLNLSHEHLDAPGAIRHFKSRTGAKLLCLVHDLIPLTHPEYTRPGQKEMHRRRMDTVAMLADAVVVNSAATRGALLRDFGAKPLRTAVHVAHLGVAPAGPAAAGDGSAAPYFLMVATIEPRKNHLLLLQLWRRMAAECARPPRLIIAGRRGWENEMVLDMLERCEAIIGIVEVRRHVNDAELHRLMHGARAMLLPSFAEGYGLPVAEALAAGTPVICSNLSAFREIGQQVPEYLDPLDGPEWMRMILDYAAPDSPRREAQCQRMRAWTAPSWDNHFRRVAEIIDGLARN